MGAEVSCYTDDRPEIVLVQGAEEGILKGEDSQDEELDLQGSQVGRCVGRFMPEHPALARVIRGLPKLEALSDHLVRERQQS